MSIPFTPLSHLSLLLFLVVSAAAAAGSSDCNGPCTGADIIKRVCPETKYHDLCVSSLISRPGSSSFQNRDLGKAAVEAVIDSAIPARSEIMKMMKRSPDPASQEALRACGKQYDRGVYNLELAEKYFMGDHFNKTYEYAPVKLWIDSANDDFNNCATMLKKQRGVEAPLMHVCETVMQLSDNAAVIIFYLVT